MKIFIVDSFTEKMFKGNPAAVCIMEENMKDSYLQNIAMEMNLSETAFINKQSDNNYNLRWFTPKEEVNLCGHATLAVMHILLEVGLTDKNSKVEFNTLSGILTAEYRDNFIILDFPGQPLKKSEGDNNLLKAIPFSIKEILEDELSYVVVMNNEEDILNMIPEFDLLNNTRRKEIIVTALSNNPDYDFVSRFFAPAIGINEDPVTGSAHCYLAPYWGKELNKKNLTGYQASKRGGFVQCSISEDRVLLKGKACTVLRGNINI